MGKDVEVEYDARFEQQYEQDILPFIKKKGHASCFEMMKEFHISYADSVHIMDTLEIRDIVDAAEPEVKGPRPLLNGKKKRCPSSAGSANPNSPSNKESESSAPTVAIPVVPNVVAKPQPSTSKVKKAARKSTPARTAKRR
jgi:hypothetical protein